MNQREMILGGLFITVVLLLLALGLSTIHKQRQADREGCERVNVLRVNQAGVLQDQITVTARTLRGRLNGLEAFRDVIEQGQSARRARLKRLRESVKEHPVPGKPYEIHCAAAYP